MWDGVVAGQDLIFDLDLSTLIQGAMRQMGWIEPLDLESLDWLPSPKDFLTDPQV